MSYPKIDGETDRIVVVGGFTEELETTVLRNCMVYFGRVVNLYRFNTYVLSTLFIYGILILEYIQYCISRI